MKVVTMWCEWDIGVNDNIWANEELARRDCAAALEDSGETLEDAERDGLIGFDEVEVTSE